MKLLFTLLILVCTIIIHAQTRRIAHRAHSGAKSEQYDGRDGNYGGGTGMHGTSMPRYIIPSPVVLILDTVKTKDGRDSLCNRWDTLHYDSNARVNDARRHPVRGIRQLGYICAPTTVQ